MEALGYNSEHNGVTIVGIKEQRKKAGPRQV
jgi:hypothetical protein